MEIGKKAVPESGHGIGMNGDRAMAVQGGERITLNVSDGTTMAAYVARPSGATQQAIMVFQETFGVNAHIRDVTRRFSREGFLAVAPELFHRTAPGFEGNDDD